MKIQRQNVMIMSDDEYGEVISYLDTETNTYGINIYYRGKLVSSQNSMPSEPDSHKLWSLGIIYFKEALGYRLE